MSLLKKIFLKFEKYIFFFIISIFLYIIFLLIIFFNFYYELLPENNIIDFNYNFENKNQILNKINSTTYYYNGNSNIQPINVIFITKKNISNIFLKNNWILNKQFSKHNLGLFKYIHLIEDKLSPVSDLFFKGKTQDYSFQIKSNSLTNREHIRFWKFGKLNNLNVYLGSISKDNGIRFYFNYFLILPYHSVDLNIDSSRDLLILEFSNQFQYTYLKSKLKIKQLKDVDDQNFLTDNNILVFTN